MGEITDGGTCIYFQAIIDACYGCEKTSISPAAEEKPVEKSVDTLGTEDVEHDGECTEDGQTTSKTDNKNDGEKETDDEKVTDVEMNRKMLIVDARSYTAAFANRAKGGGFEYTEYYSNCQVEYMNLPNIHKVRTSFNAVRTLISSAVDPSRCVLPTSAATILCRHGSWSLVGDFNYQAENIRDVVARIQFIELKLHLLLPGAPPCDCLASVSFLRVHNVI